MERAKRKEDIPAGAVVMTRKDALEYMIEKIYYHKPAKDILFLKYGGAALGCLASLTGFTLLRHFRKFLGLRREGSLSVGLSTVALPCMGSFSYHYIDVLPRVVLEEYDCAVCLELKAMSVQLFLGVFTPYCLGMAGACVTASAVGVYLPTWRQPKQICELSWALLNKGNGRQKFLGCLVLNLVGAASVVNYEAVQLRTFKRRMEARRDIGNQ